MGNGAFKSNWHILIKYQQPEGGVLTKSQVEFNAVFNYWRLRVEHIIGEVKNHDMFDGVFRGSYTILKSAIDLTVHLTNVGIKEPWMPSPCARYPGWGNHPHCP